MAVNLRMDEILKAFTEDAGDMIDAMESGLLSLESGDPRPETLNAIFRAAHTIKGDAGIVELGQIERCAHLLENYLDKLRHAEIEPSPGLTSLLLEGCDQLRALFADVVAGRLTPDQDSPRSTSNLADRLQNLLRSLDRTEGLPANSGPHGNTQIRRPAASTRAQTGEQPPQRAEHDSAGTDVRSTLAPPNQEEKSEEGSLRVRSEKLDQLIDLVGEIVAGSATAMLMAQSTGRGEVIEANASLARLIDGLRELTLQMRMVPIGDTFNRFRRVVRDLARDMQREVELTIRGEETELDKSVVEKIRDPIMHLIRNALDHGIEPAPQRVALGKPAAGRIDLNAYHEAGGIVIEVVDDGAGLDKERILAKAVERGLAQPGQALSDQEIFDLIFLAGFSTAEKVTNISGRGVGMDVVRNNIKALRGTIEMKTERERGSKFVIRLPLTMAIIEGLLIGVGPARYVIPLESITECLELKTSEVDRNYFKLRGEVLPVLRLRQLFNTASPPSGREIAIVVHCEKHSAGIVVDKLLGTSQTVIKPLPVHLRHLRGLAGVTILGSGEIALILDIPAILALARS